MYEYVSDSTQSLTVLLVDDDEIFREVTASALIEQGFTVHQATDGEHAISILQMIGKVDVIFSDMRMPRMDGLGLLKAIQATSKTPVVLTTGFSDVIETQTAHALGASGFLAKPFETRDLISCLQASREAIDPRITRDEEFSKIPIEDFVSGKILRYNIYVRLSRDKFVKIAHEGVDLDVERIQSYKMRGVRHLYLKKADFRNYLSSSLSISKRISSNRGVSSSTKQAFLKHTGALIAEKVMVDELDSFSLEASREFFMAAVDVIYEQDELFRAMELLNEHSDYLYAHSLGVSIYSIMIARHLEWKSAPTVFRVGLAGLLHDIGLKEIDKRIVDTPRLLLSRPDRVAYETHPIRSTEILSTCESVPEEVIQAIALHHEDTNGRGYPYGRKGKDITPLAHLLTVADVFCEFAIKNPDYPKGMGAAEAVDKMEQFKREAVSPEYFKVLKALVQPQS